MSELTKTDVPEGQVKLTSHGDGWWLVEVGRGRYVKRFNLQDTEARQLWDLLGTYVMGHDDT